MNYEHRRLRTFEHQTLHVFDKHLLARTGIFSSPTLNNVLALQCYFCTFNITKWSNYDDEIQIHRFISPQCPLINNHLTTNFPIDAKLFYQTIEPIPPQMNPIVVHYYNIDPKTDRYANEVTEKYFKHEDRIHSFRSTENRFKHRKNYFSTSGFFYYLRGTIQCYSCQLQITHWNDRCNIWQLHTLFSPTCTIIRNNYSSDQIAEISNNSEAILSYMTPPDNVEPTNTRTHQEKNAQSNSTPNPDVAHQKTPPTRKAKTTPTAEEPTDEADFRLSPDFQFLFDIHTPTSDITSDTRTNLTTPAPQTKTFTPETNTKTTTPITSTKINTSHPQTKTPTPEILTEVTPNLDVESTYSNSPTFTITPEKTIKPCQCKGQAHPYNTQRLFNIEATINILKKNLSILKRMHAYTTTLQHRWLNLPQVELDRFEKLATTNIHNKRPNKPFKLHAHRATRPQALYKRYRKTFLDTPHHANLPPTFEDLTTEQQHPFLTLHTVHRNLSHIQSQHNELLHFNYDLKLIDDKFYIEIIKKHKITTDFEQWKLGQIKAYTSLLPTNLHD